MRFPEHVFGGDGIKERVEYAPLQGVSLGEAAWVAGEYIDALVRASYAHGEARVVTDASADAVYREAVIEYVSFEAPSGDQLLYDETDDTVLIHEALGSFCETRVEIRQEVYSAGPLREVASLRFERTLPYTEGAFIATYVFETYAGGSVQAEIRNNNIDVDDEYSGAFYERPATAYDMQVLKREVAEAAAHFEAAEAEQNIDLYLSNPIQ